MAEVIERALVSSAAGAMAAAEVRGGAGNRVSGRRLSPKGSDLTERERCVLRLSLHDDTASLAAQDGRLARLRAVLIHADNKRLADPRLEALRRYAVHYRLNAGRPRAEQQAELTAAGYSREQVRSAEDFIRQIHPEFGDANASTAPSRLVLPIVAVCVVACVWLGAGLDNGAFLIIAAGTLLVGLLSLLAGRSV